jgi:hypothetical protein
MRRKGSRQKQKIQISLGEEGAVYGMQVCVGGLPDGGGVLATCAAASCTAWSESTDVNAHT